MKLRKFINESNIEQKAFDFVECLILSGGPHSAKCKLDNNVKKFLKDKTVTKDLTLYRGISLIKNRIDTKNIEKINNLKVGDDAPDFLMKIYGNFASYTKKKSIAKYYSREGNVSIVLKAIVKKENIIADLEQLSGGIWKDEEEYFKKDKEVIVEEPVDTKIEFIKGKLKKMEK